jgi:hypothetical protein
VFCPTCSTPSSSSPRSNRSDLYWKPPADPGPSGCPVRYRKAGDSSSWKDGLPLWYDARNRECRGSLVQLSPGTKYEIEVGGKAIVASTWSEKFPIAAR